jgi:hypothetical protein
MLFISLIPKALFLEMEKTPTCLGGTVDASSVSSYTWRAPGAATRSSTLSAHSMAAPFTEANRSNQRV